ncbi:hypothetical protein GPECTOR_240g574 [Gonium pectorale]|uniref:Uncharacterized protein n=1 Tax=Gonium pectorale TaxID=33097 RepID=A0A150FWE0_GONPE|nr:hypothetical protein GPECTOR_240g574 [Gonium pectorale]|eukprot:KXZ41932.1 hypothetical protein GPECTOR_240g574 [Gonium pectorale]
MADYVAARNDRERLEAVRNHLLRAISLFPAQQLPDQKRLRAVALARKATSRDVASGSPVQRGSAPGQLQQRLKARGKAVRASLELQKLLVPPLRAWKRLTRRRQEKFLEEEDELSEQQLERQLAALSAFAESARALDACLMALRRINIPYRHALLTAADAFMDEQVPELADLLALDESVEWGTPGNVPFLGNPLQGPYPFPEDLVFDTGAPASLDFQLLGCVWADAAVQHALAALAASNPDRSQFAQSMGRSMIPQLEKHACDAISPPFPRRATLEAASVQRGTWLVLAALQQLCAWCGGSLQVDCPVLTSLLQRLLAARGLTHLRPELAPTAARDALVGSVFMPQLPPRAPQLQPQDQRQRQHAVTVPEPAESATQPPEPLSQAAAAPEAESERAELEGPGSSPAVAAAAEPPAIQLPTPDLPSPAVRRSEEAHNVSAPAPAPVASACPPQGAAAGSVAGSEAAGSSTAAAEGPAVRGWAGGLGAMVGLLSQAASAVSAVLAPRRPSTAAVTATEAITSAVGAEAAPAPAPALTVPSVSASDGVGVASAAGSAAAGPSPAASVLEAAAAGAAAAGPPPPPPVQEGNVAEGQSDDEDEREGDNATAPEGGAGAAAAARRKRPKRKKKKKAAGAASQSDAADGAAAAAAVSAQPAAAALASAVDPAAALMAALAAEQPDCCVCLEELTPASVSLLSCVVRSAEGPFHALCNSCWAGLAHPRCPMCCTDDVDGLSLLEFLDRLAGRR